MMLLNSSYIFRGRAVLPFSFFYLKKLTLCRMSLIHYIFTTFLLVPSLLISSITAVVPGSNPVQLLYNERTRRILLVLWVSTGVFPLCDNPQSLKYLSSSSIDSSQFPVSWVLYQYRTFSIASDMRPLFTIHQVVIYLLTTPSSLALQTSVRPSLCLTLTHLTGSQSAPTSSALTAGPSGTTLAIYGKPSEVAMASPTLSSRETNARSSISVSSLLKAVNGVASERVSYKVTTPVADPVASRL